MGKRLSAGVMVVTLVCGGCATNGGNERNTPGAQQAYLGRPGKVHNTKTIAANEYGVYTFASPLNFCRGSRWILSGTMSAQWQNEPLPHLVKRGTLVEVLDRKHVSCGELDERLKLVQGDVVQYRIKGDQDTRYVLASDVYTPLQYKRYAVQQRVTAVRLQNIRNQRPRRRSPARRIRYCWEEAFNRPSR